MTAWNLHLTEQTDPQDGQAGVLRTLASLDTGEPEVMAATLRALADRLDPPKPPRPAYRTTTDRREVADERFRQKLAGYGDQTTGNAYDAQCRGNDCNEGHTYLAGCALWPALTLDDAGRERMGEDRRAVEAREMVDVQDPPPGPRRTAVTRDVPITSGPLAGMRQRRYGRTAETALDRDA